MQNNDNILAIDPGRKKNGVAVVNQQGEPAFLGIFATEELYLTVEKLHSTYGFSLLVIGDGTASAITLAQMQPFLQNHGITVVLQDEKHSTEEARKLYFKRNPPPWYLRLIPIGLLTPPVAYDDITALVIALRYQGATKSNFLSQDR